MHLLVRQIVFDLHPPYKPKNTSYSHLIYREFLVFKFEKNQLMVVIAGAELFTGNVLITMAWVEGKVNLKQVLRIWSLACFSNLIGACSLALLIFLSGAWKMNGGEVGQVYLKIAISQATTPFR